MTKERPLDIRFIEYMPFDGNKWSTQKLIPYMDVVQRIEEGTGVRLDEVGGVGGGRGVNETAKSYQLEGYRGLYFLVLFVCLFVCFI